MASLTWTISPKVLRVLASDTFRSSTTVFDFRFLSYPTNPSQMAGCSADCFTIHEATLEIENWYLPDC